MKHLWYLVNSGRVTPHRIVTNRYTIGWCNEAYADLGVGMIVERDLMEIADV
jgi:hypothetical protein